MKKFGFSVLVITAVLMLSSCGRFSAWNQMKFTADLLGLTKDEGYEESDKVKEELGVLSDDEKRILSRDGYSGKDRIYAGNLYDYEIERVKNIRAAKAYLEEKYPEHTFKITLYESRGKQSSSPTGNIGDDLLWLQMADNEERHYYWVKVIELENGIELEDNIGDSLN